MKMKNSCENGKFSYEINKCTKLSGVGKSVLRERKLN